MEQRIKTSDIFLFDIIFGGGGGGGGGDDDGGFSSTYLWYSYTNDNEQRLRTTTVFSTSSIFEMFVQKSLCRFIDSPLKSNKSQ